MMYKLNEDVIHNNILYTKDLVGALKTVLSKGKTTFKMVFKNGKYELPVKMSQITKV